DALLQRCSRSRTHRAPAGRDAGATHPRAGAGLRRPERPRRVAPRPAAGTGCGQTRSHRAAGGEEHAEPHGVGSGQLSPHRAVPSDHLFGPGARRAAGRHLSGSAPRAATRDRAGPGRDRHAAARRAGGRFFHGYYGHYCYLPLYIFCGEHLLCARLRPSNQDASAGSLVEVQRIVAQIRARWPKTKIVLRADSGFCREELMEWCESHGVHYVFGLARNTRLRRKMAREMRQAREEHRRTGKPARVFAELRYRTRRSWSQSRRVVGKAEYLARGENPRYVVTSLPASEWPARELYEQCYCARGEMENRIKEQFQLFSDRMSTETMRANQLRLYFSSLAYVLVAALRRLGLAGTEWATAQVDTIRLRLLKIAAQVRVTARRIWIRYSRSYPWKQQFAAAWAALRC